jgi:hypothetical protein
MSNIDFYCRLGLLALVLICATVAIVKLRTYL